MPALPPTPGRVRGSGGAVQVCKGPGQAYTFKEGPLENPALGVHDGSSPSLRPACYFLPVLQWLSLPPHSLPHYTHMPCTALASLPSDFHTGCYR